MLTELTDTSFAIDLGFKITNVTQESLSNRLTLTNETETQIQDSINRLVRYCTSTHKIHPWSCSGHDGN